LSICIRLKGCRRKGLSPKPQAQGTISKIVTALGDARGEMMRPGVVCNFEFKGALLRSSNTSEKRGAKLQIQGPNRIYNDKSTEPGKLHRRI
jgi:hypothetical protein